tara:strand:- start:252 stop:773 length:522 start_codon:yes stop_codon:yes gene_type:complete
MKISKRTIQRMIKEEYVKALKEQELEEGKAKNWLMALQMAAAIAIPTGLFAYDAEKTGYKPGMYQQAPDPAEGGVDVGNFKNEALYAAWLELNAAEIGKIDDHIKNRSIEQYQQGRDIRPKYQGVRLADINTSEVDQRKEEILQKMNSNPNEREAYLKINKRAEEWSKKGGLF